jgi:hypothetical protein
MTNKNGVRLQNEIYFRRSVRTERFVADEAENGETNDAASAKIFNVGCTISAHAPRPARRSQALQRNLLFRVVLNATHYWIAANAII